MNSESRVALSKPVGDEIRKTTCYMCACRCGIDVHVKDGKIRYIEGNRDHPVNRGVLCAKGSAGIMLLYIFAGPWLPGLLAHKGASLARAASQMWLTSEGIFGVALGVSTSVVFLFVLFGALLERAGAGNYFIQMAFAMLGTYRGGPAKAAVAASGLTGMISGSSIANTVTTGTFHHPADEARRLLRGEGRRHRKRRRRQRPDHAAGDGRRRVPHRRICRHHLCRGGEARLPAGHSDLRRLVLHRRYRGGEDATAWPSARFDRAGASCPAAALMTVCGIVILSGLVYYGIGWTKTAFGDAASWVLGLALIAAYLGLIRHKATHPDLPADDVSKAIVKVPDFYATANTGLHYLLPVIVLIWCLMVEELSPGLSAFWGTALLIVVMLTQRPLLAFFRNEHEYVARLRDGFDDLIAAFQSASRNMTSVGIATAAAGIIVGTVALTGVGLVMTEIVEAVSGGNLIVMLLMTAVICSSSAWACRPRRAMSSSPH